MRVILAGTTGVNKEKVANRIISKVLANNSLPPDPQNVNSLEYIRHFDFEDELEKKNKIKLWAFLSTLNVREQQIRWNDTFDEIERVISSQPPKHVFLSLHATFFKNSRFFSLIDLDRIKKFRPDLIITLIDDTYAVWQRVVNKSKSQSDPGQSYLRLRDIMAWRSVEILVSDMLAKTLSIKNYVIAVKHPTETIYDLIFNPRKLIIYASFPISVTRKSKDGQKEVNSFREELHKNYITLDPLTIDEKIIQFALKKGAKTKDSKGKHWFCIQKEDRWTFPPGYSLVSEDDLDFPIKLDEAEIQEVAKFDIDHNVRARDLRMVSDADVLVGYRPYFGKIVHEGIKSEIDFANATSKPCYLYFPTDDQEDDPSPFQAQGVVFKNISELYETLKTLSPSENRKWGGV